jgi:hypothetical protein
MSSHPDRIATRSGTVHAAAIAPLSAEWRTACGRTLAADVAEVVDADITCAACRRALDAAERARGW